MLFTHRFIGNEQPDPRSSSAAPHNRTIPIEEDCNEFADRK